MEECSAKRFALDTTSCLYKNGHSRCPQPPEACCESGKTLASRSLASLGRRKSHDTSSIDTGPCSGILQGGTAPKKNTAANRNDRLHTPFERHVIISNAKDGNSHQRLHCSVPRRSILFLLGDNPQQISFQKGGRHCTVWVEYAL